MKHIQFLFVLLAIISCDDENNVNEPAGPPAMFTLTVDPDFALNKDNWVIIQDKNGDVLDYQQIKTSGTFKFETDRDVPDEEISVTFFKYDSLIFQNYHLDSYSSVPTGRTWTWKKSTRSPILGDGGSDGSFSVNYTVPTPLRMSYFSNSFTEGRHSQTLNTLYYQVVIPKKDRNFLLTIAGDGNPRYRFFENVKRDDHFNVTFEEMSEYDKVVEISFPPAISPKVEVFSVLDDGKSQYHTYDNSFNRPPFEMEKTVTNLKIGYLDRFKKYSTFIYIPTAEFEFRYEKVGSAPDAISFPEHPPFQLSNTTVGSFAYTNEILLTKRSSLFLYSPKFGVNIWWLWHAPDKFANVAQLPQLLLDRYPFLIAEKFEHVFTDFETSTRSYTGYLDNVGKGTPEDEEFERTTIVLK